MAITGLVLQGGGALGAFELGVVECLLDNGIRPDIVSGVSIGAINATVLCGCRHSDPKSALRELWADLTTFSFPLQWAANMNQKMSMFGNPGMYRPRTDYFNITGWTSFYDTAPLDETLARNVDFKKLRPANFKLKPKDQAPRLILTATNLLTGRLERFDSKDMQIEAAHVRASGSLPPSFPPTAAPSPDKGVEQLYWDGGLFDNTPLSKVDQVVEAHGVTIMGPSNLPGALAADSSSLYARNLFNFVSLIVDKKSGALNLDWNDEIVKGSAVTKDGAVVQRG